MGFTDVTALSASFGPVSWLTAAMQADTPTGWIALLKNRARAANNAVWPIG